MSNGELIQLPWELIGQNPSDTKAKPSGDKETRPVTKALAKNQNLDSNNEKHGPGERKSLKDKI